MAHHRRIAVVGLGYVGLPVAAAFSRSGARVVAFDISSSRIKELRAGYDRTKELTAADLAREELYLTDNPDDLRAADFFIITVPTPIDDARRPDLRFLLSASRTVGKRLKRGDIVVYESTVYPGATEEECVPVLEGIRDPGAGARSRRRPQGCAKRIRDQSRVQRCSSAGPCRNSRRPAPLFRRRRLVARDQLAQERQGRGVGRQSKASARTRPAGVDLWRL
jgi:hypothetical protein